MGKYGQASIKAVGYIHTKVTSSPIEAWDKATREIFGEGTWSQRKGCPKNAFLGLCEEGIVHGIQSGSYSKSLKNKSYAVKAVEIIKKNPEFATDRNILWKHVVEGASISHNAQMDVVVSLWKNNLIKD